VYVFSRLSTGRSGPPAKDRKVMPIDWYDAKTGVCAVVIYSKIVRNEGAQFQALQISKTRKRVLGTLILYVIVRLAYPVLGKLHLFLVPH
jgi:hypothetical protein